MSVKKRVRLIAQSLLTYEHWHPEFRRGSRPRA